MPDATTVALIAGLMGLLFGSFLNVCTLRWPKNESVVRPPSHCGSCGAQIRWFDNIPVLSWLLLRGRCRGCDTRISIQYPLVELATALIWAGMFLSYGPTPEALRAFGISPGGKRSMMRLFMSHPPIPVASRHCDGSVDRRVQHQPLGAGFPGTPPIFWPG